MRVARFAVPSTLDPVAYAEYPGAALTKPSEISVTSSIDPTVTIKVKINYPTAGTNLPMLVFTAGYHDRYTSLDADPGADNSPRWTRLGYMLVMVDTRGMGNSTPASSWDDGGREAHDIYDAIKYVQANFISILAPDKISFVGYSRGGGMALIMGARYPDLFQSITDYFGMGVWGNDATHGWYEQTAAFRATMQTAIGGTPAAKPNEYNARNSRDAIIQNHIGFLSMYHDFDDTAVSVDQSQYVAAGYIAAGRSSDYYYSETNSGSPYRWTHGYPTTVNDLIQSETTWMTGVNQRAKMYLPRTIASSGTVYVFGYLWSKKFTAVGDDGTDANAYRSRTFTVVYDVNANTYSATNTSSLSGRLRITTFDGKTDIQTIAAGATVVITPI